MIHRFVLKSLNMRMNLSQIKHQTGTETAGSILKARVKLRNSHEPNFQKQRLVELGSAHHKSMKFDLGLS